jgi:protein-S-isoprenylcysteine O-methyltransferase Ste14
MLLPILASVVRLTWVFIEFPYVLRHRVKPTRNWDRHSAKCWDAANLIELVGMVLGFIGIGRMHGATNVVGSLGLLLLLAGITIRWVAIRTLGKYFTGLIVIKTDHRLIQSGLYKYVRHPAYTGALLAHLGLGLSFANWFTLVFSSVPVFIAALYRMHIEEDALADAFGSEYLNYAKTSKRLIPRLY